MAKTKRKPSAGTTTPSQFRLKAETLAEMKWLATELGLESNSDVIRLLVRAEAKKRGYKAENKS